MKVVDLIPHHITAPGFQEHPVLYASMSRQVAYMGMEIMLRDMSHYHDVNSVLVRSITGGNELMLVDPEDDNVIVMREQDMRIDRKDLAHFKLMWKDKYPELWAVLEEISDDE